MRRVRAKIEKGGSMDVLHNQVIEHKVIDLILEHAQFEEVAYPPGGHGRGSPRPGGRRRRALRHSRGQADGGGEGRRRAHGRPRGAARRRDEKRPVARQMPYFTVQDQAGRIV